MIISHRIHVYFYSDPLRTLIRFGFLHERTQRRSALIFKTMPLRARFSTRGWKQNKNGKPTTAKTARGMGVKKKIIAVTTKTTPTSGNTIRCHHGRRGTLCATCFFSSRKLVVNFCKHGWRRQWCAHLISLHMTRLRQSDKVGWSVACSL